MCNVWYVNRNRTISYHRYPQNQAYLLFPFDDALISYVQRTTKMAKLEASNLDYVIFNENNQS
jgi:hypothetical protein